MTKTLERGGIVAVLLGLSFATGCGDSGDNQSAARPRASAQPASVPDADTARPLFREVSAASGLSFLHVNGATAEHFFPEIMGSGGALLDYDKDGDLDVFLVQGGRINMTTPPLFAIPEKSTSSRLFRNDLVPGGEPRFVDVTNAAGLNFDSYGMGVGTGDIDNDGDVDLYVTDLASNALFLNSGDGTFTRRDSSSDETDSGWSTSVSFLDYDLDGALDLFVSRYVQVDLLNSRVCSGSSGQRDYCTPDVFPPLPDLLFSGDGAGGLEPQRDWRASPMAPKTGLGVVAADYNLDGYPDLYVANDKKPNQLWINRRNGTFEETAVMSGSAQNVDGKAEASMGVTSGDVDADGDEDLFVTHLKGETNTLYINLGEAGFLDSTIEFRLSSASMPSTGFGTRWFDYDNDGDLDLFVANGAVMIEAAQLGVEAFPYKQANQLFENTGDLRFADASARAGFHTEPREVSRGAAFGDIDNDGDVDILVTNNNGPARLLLNDSGLDNDWLSVRLQGSTANRDGVGARVGVEREGLPTLWRRVGTDGSYLSANDIRTHFGLGRDAVIRAVLVDWPGGERERYTGIEPRQFLTLVQGQGESP